MNCLVLFPVLITAWCFKLQTHFNWFNSPKRPLPVAENAVNCMKMAKLDHIVFDESEEWIEFIYDSLSSPPLQCVCQWRMAFSSKIEKQSKICDKSHCFNATWQPWMISDSMHMMNAPAPVHTYMYTEFYTQIYL